MRESYSSSLAVGLEAKYRKLEQDIMADVVRRIKEAGKITSMADWQLNRMLMLGKSTSDIEKIIASAVGYNTKEVERLYEEVIANEYTIYKPQYERITGNFIPYAENYQLQQAVKAITAQTEKELSGITRSLGFMIGKGKPVYTPLSEIYNGYLDQAMIGLTAGMYDYNTLIRRVCKELTDSGLRTVDYASGWHNRVDVAARRAVLTGASQLSSKIMDMNAESLGVEKFEVSWHAGARPDHAAWQGKVYTRKQLESICGLGSGGGLLGWNCRHEYYPFFEGSERTYTDKWLEEQNAREARKKAFRGKEYNAYEATQKQRRMETNMRAQREEVQLLEEGGADSEDITIERCKYQAQLDEYKAFSKAFDLPEQRERIYYDLRGRVAPSQKTYAAYVRERELQATAVRSATEMHEKVNLGITAPEGTREYTKQRTAAIIRLGVEAEKPVFATDQFGEYAAAITPIPGVYDVAMHGSPKRSEVFGHITTARNVAAIIRQRDDYTPGTPVRLLSCETGKGEECFAQLLADELRVEVSAPNDILWARSDHSFTIGASRYENTGKMETFKPRENK